MALAEDAKQRIREQYPQFAWAVDHPDVGPILQRSIDEAWPAGRLQGEITKTNWWKHTEPTLRQWQADVANDPAKTEQMRRQKQADIWDQWLRLGGKPDANFVNDIAIQALSLGWNESQMNDELVKRIQFDSYNPSPLGAIGTTMRSLQQSAREWYIPLDDGTAFSWARSIAAGERTAEDYVSLLQQQSAGQFPTLAENIKKGISPEQFFSPYKQRIAQVLERDPNTIDFMNDPKMRQVIDMVDEKGTRRTMTLSETDRFARGLDEWKGTRQGQEAASEMAQSLMTTFGKVAQ